MQKITPRNWILIVVFLMASAVAILSYRATAAGTITITGNTAAAENQPGWMFNRNVENPAPYTFNFDVHSLGIGGLFVGPVTDVDTNKFVAEYFPGTLKTSDVRSISYDYMLGSQRPDTDAQFITLSVLANIDDSTNDFDCRYDYVAVSGPVGSFVKPVVFAEMAPSSVTKHGDRVATCAPTLSSMPEGSYVRVITLTVGNDTAADAGLTAYFDNVEISLLNDTTNFNFEPAPKTPDDCAGKKWQQYNFRNQGQCQQYVTKGKDTR